MLHGHECPARITTRIPVRGTLPTQYAPDPGRANNLHLYITSSSMIDPHFDINMFQCFKVVLLQHLLSDRHLALETSGRDELSATVLVIGEGAIVQLDGFCVEPSLRFDKFPRLCCCHVLVAIEDTKAVLVAVKLSIGDRLPVGVVRIDLARCLYTEILDVAPTQVRSDKKLASVTDRMGREHTELQGPMRRRQLHSVQPLMFLHG